jgi:hypothetical protein
VTSKLHGLIFLIKKLLKYHFTFLRKLDFIRFYFISIDFLVSFFLLGISIALPKLKKNLFFLLPKIVKSKNLSPNQSFIVFTRHTLYLST